MREVVEMTGERVDARLGKALAEYRHQLLVDGEVFILLGVPKEVIDPERVSTHYGEVYP